METKRINIAGMAINQVEVVDSKIQVYTKARPVNNDPMATVNTNIPCFIGFRMTSIVPIPRETRTPPDQRNHPDGIGSSPDNSTKYSGKKDNIFRIQMK